MEAHVLKSKILPLIVPNELLQTRTRKLPLPLHLPVMIESYAEDKSCTACHIRPRWGDYVKLKTATGLHIHEPACWLKFSHFLPRYSTGYFQPVSNHELSHIITNDQAIALRACTKRDPAAMTNSYFVPVLNTEPWDLIILGPISESLTKFTHHILPVLRKQRYLEIECSLGSPALHNHVWEQ